MTGLDEDLGLLSGRPAGISFWHVVSARLYWDELVSMRGPAVLNVTVLF